MITSHRSAPAPASIPSFWDQQERFALARPPFPDPAHWDALGHSAHVCLQNPARVPPTSLASPALPPTDPPSSRQCQGSDVPPALHRRTSKVDLYFQADLALGSEEFKAKRILCCCKEWILSFLPLILANDLMKRLHPPSSSPDGTFMLPQDPERRTFAIICALGSGPVLQLLLPKSAFINSSSKGLEENPIPFAQDQAFGPTQHLLGFLCFAACLGVAQACSERHSLVPGHHPLPNPRLTKAHQCAPSPRNRGKDLCRLQLRSWASYKHLKMMCLFQD